MGVISTGRTFARRTWARLVRGQRTLAVQTFGERTSMGRIFVCRRTDSSFVHMGLRPTKGDEKPGEQGA